MIPKKIHYVWLGKNKKPKVVQDCIQSWRKKLPGYEIIEWNEDNFPMHINAFIEEAYKLKKWAFVSDFIRIYAVEKYGGIYLDTDVKVVSNFSKLVENECFVGFETSDKPFTAVFGGKAHHPLLKDMKNLYKNLHFENQKEMDLINTDLVSDLLIKKYKCVPNGIQQNLEYGIKVYDQYTLCDPSAHSICIHIRQGSWVSGDKSFFAQVGARLRAKLNNRLESCLYFYLKKIQSILKIKQTK